MFDVTLGLILGFTFLGLLFVVSVLGFLCDQLGFFGGFYRYGPAENEIEPTSANTTNLQKNGAPNSITAAYSKESQLSQPSTKSTPKSSNSEAAAGDSDRPDYRPRKYSKKEDRSDRSFRPRKYSEEVEDDRDYRRSFDAEQRRARRSSMKKEKYDAHKSRRLTKTAKSTKNPPRSRGFRPKPVHVFLEPSVRNLYGRESQSERHNRHSTPTSSRNDKQKESGRNLVTFF